MKSTMIGASLAVISLLFLASCGGGGGSSPPPTNPPDPPMEEPEPDPDPEPEPDPDPESPTPEPDPEPMPEPEPPSVRSILGTLVASATTVTDASTMDGDSYLWGVTVQPKPDDLQLEDITRQDDDTFQRLGLKRGVERTIVTNGTLLEYGGWMEHSFFFVRSLFTRSGGPLNPVTTTSTHTYSLGDASGSNPIAGSATWEGVMVGVDGTENAPTAGNLVTGDATITMDDFTVPVVDIAFTHIRDTVSGKSHDNFGWEALALEDGVFADHIDDVTGEILSDPLAIELTGRQPPPGALTPGQISGQFYGPNHEEVGGVFERNHIVGAFGATRE